MSYTEYLDIIVRNSRQLGQVDDRIQRIRDNLEAISGRPLQAAVGGGAAQAARPSAAAQLDSRDLRAVQQTSRRQTARDRVRLPAPTRRIQDALQQIEQVVGGAEADAAARLNDVADQVGQTQSRGRRRGRSFRQQVGTVRAENRFAAGYGATDRQAANEAAVREQRRQSRLRAQYDVPLPPKRIAVTGPRATGTIAQESRLRTANQQLSAQLLAAQQVGGEAIKVAERTARIASRLDPKDLDGRTALAREARAGAERGRRTNQNRNSRQLGIGERGDLLRRSRDIVSRLPEGRQEEVRRRVAEGLLANRRALREGRTVAARFERDRVRQFLTRKERGLAEEGRAETRARVPAKAGRLANRAEKLAAQANQIDIQRGTPLGDELFGKAADIGSAATKQKNALRKSVVSGKATTKSVNEATDSLAELQSAFDTLKVRAGGMQKTAKESAAKVKADNAEGLRIGRQNTSPVRGNAGFAGSPNQLQDVARRNLREGLRIGRLNSTPLSAAKNIEGSAAFKREQDRRSLDEGLRIGRLNSTPLSAAKNIEGSAAFAKQQQQAFDAQVRANERSSKAAVDLEKQKQASFAAQVRENEKSSAAAVALEGQKQTSLRAQNAEGLRIGRQNTSPTRGGAGFAGSPKLLEDTARRNLREGLRIGRLNSTPLSAAKDIPGSAAFAEAEAARRSRLSGRAQDLALRAEGTVGRAQLLQQNPATGDALRVKAKQAEVIAQKSLNNLTASGNAITDAGLKTEQRKLSAVNQRLKLAKDANSLEQQQQKSLERRESDFSRSEKQRQTGVQKRGEGVVSGLNNVLIGASFPLLTGQGLGGAIGGGVGGGIGAALGGGAGFGLSIAGSVVGAAFDQTAKAASAMADSLGSPTELLQNMDAAGIKAGRGLSDTVAQLEATGRSAEAQALIFSRLEQLGGSGYVQDLNALRDANKGLQSSWTQLVVSIQAQLLPSIISLVKWFRDLADAGNSVSTQARARDIDPAAFAQAQNRADKEARQGSILPSEAQRQKFERLLTEESKRIIEADSKKRGPATPPPLDVDQQRKSLETQRNFERGQVDLARSRASETEALIRRQEDLINAQTDQARQEFDLQRAIADFRIRTEDQIASKRADLVRQELEISKIRGQISDSQLTSRFDNQIEAAPNDQAAKILSAAKEEALARKDLERTIRDGRIETSLRIDQIERSSRQEQRALENDRIALERQRDSVIRSRISLERQTEDLKRDTADYQLNVARQIEDSALRAAAAMRAGAEGLLGGAATGGGGPLAQEVLSGFDRIRGATSFRTKGTSGVREAISPNGGNEYFDFNGATREAVASRIATWTKADWVSAINTALGEGKPGADVYNVIANIAARSAKEPSARVADLVTRPQQYVANAKQGLNINNISDPAFGKKLFGARFDQLLNQIGSGSNAAPSFAGGGQVIGRTGNTGISSGPHTDVRFADGRPISAADADRFLSIGGRAPSSYGVTSGYGPRRAPVAGASTFHKGIDFGTPEGLSVALKGGATFAGGLSASESGGGGVTGIINTPIGQMRVLHMERVIGRGGGAAAPSRAALPGVSVGTAPFDLKAQAARDAQLQRDRQKAEEDAKREELRRREEDTLRAVVGKDSIVRKREELTLATRIAEAGLQSTDTEQKLLELRIASTREQEILRETVAELGPLTKEREEALLLGLKNKREELAIAEGLLKIEKERQVLADLQATQKEIQNFATGIDAGFGVGTQASSAYVNAISRGDTPAQAKAQADAVRTLTLLQETVQDAQAIGGSIGDGIQNALIAAVTGGDIQQAFSAMFATIGNTLIQSALRPIEESITNAAFALLRPNLTQENLDIAGNIAKQQEAVAAASLNAAGTQLGIAAFQLQTAASQLASNNIVSSSFGGGGLVSSLVGGLFSGAGPVSGAFGGGGLSSDLITQAFSGGFNFFAGGGNPQIGAPSIVGEAGPEVSVARGLSTIVSNGRSADLMDTLKNPQARDTGSSGPGDTNISYDGPVLNFDSTNYVKQDDVPRIVNQAVKQSHGYTTERARNSPSYRRQIGMR